MVSLRNATVLLACTAMLGLPISWAQSQESAARLYDEGVAFEKRGDEQAAFKSFLAAGEAGHGLAQKKLGEIYDDRQGPVERDYATSLQWFEKARAQGVPIPKPMVQAPR
jgi:TPR repeat protein